MSLRFHKIGANLNNFSIHTAKGCLIWTGLTKILRYKLARIYWTLTKSVALGLGEVGVVAETTEVVEVDEALAATAGCCGTQTGV